MLLHTLLRQFDPGLSLASIPDLDIAGVREDSRQVRPGDLFIARAGLKADGARFLQDAKTRGAAAAIVATPAADAPLPQVVVGPERIASAASVLANALHGHPSRDVRVLGVTGTNGKTTTTYLIRHLLATVDRRCGMVGTVEIDDGRTRREADMTTPAACDIAGLLATMRDADCDGCAIEVSSHALDQGRVAGVRFAAAAFTNLTQDHLDYHKTMDQYAAAKARLFSSLDALGIAAINGDDAFADRITRDCPGRIVRFGFGESCDYRATDPSVTAQGTTFTLTSPQGTAHVSMPLIGRHNIENALTAAALVGEVFGMTAQQIATGLRDAHGAPGRLQVVRAGQPFAVLVDYAHTHDALENVLQALRPLTAGTLRVLFGCGGDRDRTKRPRMAHSAERLADAVYVTSDNPRTEQPEAIIEQIKAGFSDAGRAKAIVEPDRRAAIERILSDAQPGDVVLIAGKGHENYQIVGTEKRHFDDVEEAIQAIRGRASAAA